MSLRCLLMNAYNERTRNMREITTPDDAHQSLPITRKEIVNQTGCPYYIVDYLRQCGRLPIIAESLKRGVPTLFHPDSIKIVQEHIDGRYKSN